MRIVNMAHGNLYAIGAYVAAWAIGLASSELHVSLLFVLLITGALAAALAGAIIDPAFLRPLYRRPQEDHVLMTFGLLLVLGAGWRRRHADLGRRAGHGRRRAHPRVRRRRDRRAGKPGGRARRRPDRRLRADDRDHVLRRGRARRPLPHRGGGPVRAAGRPLRSRVTADPQP